MKTVNKIIIVFFIFLLAGCTHTAIIKDTTKDVEQSINKEMADTYDDLNIAKIIEINPNEETALSEEFTGEIYILAERQEIDQNIEEAQFKLQLKTFDNIKQNSPEDFNIRYNGKTYFSIKKLDINTKQINIETNWKTPILVALRKETQKE